ncbi:nitrate- and nitrite sensing domain-containing protein [Streptomyces sp. ODS05-4]|uniref:sensor histidine kinase n=1 Tax=Streptomyces sp. ODS05-4 TaxID=2944939 RepID=UPI00210BD65A|nr:nitrate- and nitrite sensing domain-containing protein [Streptomyces sp. ODS05-4]
MRRSTTSAASTQARGNFTPPARTATPPAETPGKPPAGPASPRGEQAPGGSGRLSPRNWRVATRLNAILLIPVLVGLVMGGFQVKTSIDTWREAQDAEKTALIVQAAYGYGQNLLNERDVTAVPLLTAKSDGDRKADAVTDAYAQTDEAKKRFDEAVKDMPSGQGLERRLELFRQAEPELAKIRETAYTRATDPVLTELGYVKVQHTLMEFANELGLGTGNITSYGRMVYAIQLSQAAESLQRSIGVHLLVRPSAQKAVFDEQSKTFNSYVYLEQIALAEFQSGGTPEDERRLAEVMRERAKDGAERLREAGLDPPVSKGENPSVYDGMAAAIGNADDADGIRALAAQDVTAETWMGAATSKFDGYSTVTEELMKKAVDEASAISADARNDALLNGAIVVVALLAAFILAGMMARQMSRSMRELRTAAFGIAEQRLPMLVDQLSRTEPGRVDTRVQPIPIDSRDEIGEVARAFDQVHREAVRLAAEQALLRGNVNAIFTNLSRRNQSLIEGQLTLITDLENNEADPDQLENLFRLDHLATRMRRNGENLLVLAGEEPGRRWNQPVPLVDVLRAASSEVESYERIELTGVPESEIHGQAVTDLVHLLAELLENATTFSSPQTKVRVTATRLPDGRVMIEIHDKGIGLTAEDFADINHRLANPPTVDAAISQRMGLFVVGRLSDRHGIRVQLRPSGEQAGTTSLVMLPDAITHGGGGDPSLDGDFTVSSIIPEQQAPAAFEPEPAPMRTAAELGFDDSRYEQQGEGAALDPVGRSKLRDERRAALGAQLGNGFGDGNGNGLGDAGEGNGVADGRADELRPEPQGAYGGYPQQQYDTAGGYPAGNGYPGPDAYAGGQQGYDGGQGGYESAQNGYGQQQGYADYGQQNEGYDQGDGYAPQSDGYAQDEGRGQDGYPSGEYPHPGYPESGYAESGFPGNDGAAQSYGESFDAQSHQGGWPEQNTYTGGFGGGFGAESESPQGAPENAADRVGFSSGPAAGNGHEMTDAGLPRRGGRPQSPAADRSSASRPTSDQTPTASGSNEPDRTQAAPPVPQPSSGGGKEGPDDWRSANDERWARAGKLRDPKAGGVTPSGLPRRVPKANLVEGTAEQTPQGGPQVSRAPEDVRGRLSNLRRGVQQGRKQGTDTNGPATYDQHSGPGSTYNQER